MRRSDPLNKVYIVGRGVFIKIIKYLFYMSTTVVKKSRTIKKYTYRGLEIEPLLKMNNE